MCQSDVDNEVEEKLYEELKGKEVTGFYVGGPRNGLLIYFKDGGTLELTASGKFSISLAKGGLKFFSRIL